MYFQEPTIEFIRLDLNNHVLTSSECLDAANSTAQWMSCGIGTRADDECEDELEAW